jgi:CRP/FNR family transcriptional regulator, nitrogen oxide reductase regulator
VHMLNRITDQQPRSQTTVLRPVANGFDNRTGLGQRVALVQQFALFAGFSAADCASIVSSAHERDFARRQTIFFEGDPMQQIVLLTSGCVKVTQFGQNGSEVILRLSGPGEVLGSIEQCSRASHCSTAQALQTSRVLIWDAAVFESICERHPILRRNTARILGDRLRELEERFREISTEKVAPRLSSQLVRLLNQVGRRVNGFVEISLSREELAQLTGTTLFTVSRLLSQWEQRGIVSARREAVLVRDLPGLVELSQGD